MDNMLTELGFICIECLVFLDHHMHTKSILSNITSRLIKYIKMFFYIIYICRCGWCYQSIFMTKAHAYPFTYFMSVFGWMTLFSMQMKKKNRKIDKYALFCTCFVFTIIRNVSIMSTGTQAVAFDSVHNFCFFFREKYYQTMHGLELNAPNHKIMFEMEKYSYDYWIEIVHDARRKIPQKDMTIKRI